MAELQRYGATKKTGEDSYKVLKICDSMKDVDGEMDVQQSYKDLKQQRKTGKDSKC